MSNTIGIIDYDCGNIRSVINAIEYHQYNIKMVSHPSQLAEVSKIILPGVGAFDPAMQSLEKLDFVEALKNWVGIDSHKLLGICLGMQLLCNISEESLEARKGLGFIDADVRLLTSSIECRLPNMGWSEVEFCTNEWDCFNGDYYFVHSYGVFCKNDSSILAKSTYGDTSFASGITNGVNITGFQFHPEKSHYLGLSLIEDFLKK